MNANTLRLLKQALFKNWPYFAQFASNWATFSRRRSPKEATCLSAGSRHIHPCMTEVSHVATECGQGWNGAGKSAPSVNLKAYLTDSSIRFVRGQYGNFNSGDEPEPTGRDRQGGERPITPEVRLRPDFALMAGVERLAGRAGVSYRIRYYDKRISQRDRRRIAFDNGTGT